MNKTQTDAAIIVAKHHEVESNAATQLLAYVGESITCREYRHAINLLESAIDHLKAAEIIQRVLKDIGRTG